MIGHFRPAFEQAAAILFEQMGGKVVPSNPLFPVMLLVRQMAEDLDSHTMDCLQEADAIRMLVRRIAALMPEAEASRLEQAIAAEPSTPEDFHAIRLHAYLSGLRRVLAEVHGWLELSEAPERDGLLRQVWAHLEARAAYESRLVGQMW